MVAPPPNGAIEAGKSRNFSWAAMAGVAYKVAPTWIVDAGVRYLDLGDVPSTKGAGVTNTALVFRNLNALEARIGLRLLLD